MSKGITFRTDYANGDGICVSILNEAPSDARTKADVIALYTVKKKGRKLVESTASYYTPDEAMSVAIGLMRAVETVMTGKYKEFRNEKDGL